MSHVDAEQVRMQAGWQPTVNVTVVAPFHFAGHSHYSEEVVCLPAEQAAVLMAAGYVRCVQERTQLPREWIDRCN